MFTSGSTGRPKGVTIPHRAIVRLVRGQSYVSLTPAETFLQFAPASFDASTLEIWGPLLNGGRLAIAPPGALSLAQIAEAIRTFGVTSLWLTSGLFNLMADEQLNAFAPLRQLLAGGDILSIPHLRKVRAAHPHLRLINGYGPTESTTFACCHTITAPDLSPASPPSTPSTSSTPSIPIGTPIANTTVRILDDTQSPVPIGTPGELYIGGDGLALGYWNQPTLTAEKFIQLDGQTFYRTGDRVRWLPSGLIQFLGRQDHQVKIRGYRIELAEIESALAHQPGVLRSVVIPLGDGPDKQLAAYHAGPAEPATLREALRQSLPDYMVPAFFIRLASLPLTENGKVDRARLPVPPVPSVLSVPFVPSTDLEQTLASLWSAVLPHPAPGLHDNFFDIGGTSLKLVEAHSRLTRLLRRHIPVTALFQYPTIASLAAFLAPEAANAATAANPPKPSAPPACVTPADRARMQREALARKQLSQKVP
jgi:aspartate racemase